tara:strand:- start:100 stop:912 length:813 start_codon:yes stop_codon:yes gene_type:complete
MERRLFEASAYSNPFWSDTIDNENLKHLRHEIKRRRQAQDHASERLQVRNVMCGLSLLACVASLVVSCNNSTGDEFDPGAFIVAMGATWVTAFLAMGFFAAAASYKQIVNAGVTYRWEWIYERSVARFNQWHGSLGSTDPRLYAEVATWLQRERQHAEEMARLAAIQRAQEAAAAEQRYQEERRAAEQRNQERERDLQMQRDKEARQQDRKEQGYREHDYEGDRRRAEANEQARQEASRASGPTCVFCDRPGIASTASGWMCGLHAQGLL